MHSKTLLFGGLVLLATNAGNTFARVLPDLELHPGARPSIPVGTPAPSASRLSQAFPVATPGPEEQRCVAGDSDNVDVDLLCRFTCELGFCPEPTCFCLSWGPVARPPPIVKTGDFIAYPSDYKDYKDYNRLCEFACKYGFCPEDTCQLDDDEWEIEPSVEDWHWKGWEAEHGSQQCPVFKTTVNHERSLGHCANYCREIIEDAVAEGRRPNVGCVGYFAPDKPIPWTQYPGSIGEDMVYAPGMCVCDNVFVNLEADAIIDALPDINELECPIVMSALKLVISEGPRILEAVGPDGESVSFDPALDAVAAAAQLLAYTYPESEDPEGAFEFWLSPCDGSNVVPEDIRQVYTYLTTIPAVIPLNQSFKPPKNIKMGSGKKGDAANPTNPEADTDSDPNGTIFRGVSKARRPRPRSPPPNKPPPNKPTGSGVHKKKKCNVKPAASTMIMGRARNTLRVQSCVGAPGGGSTTRMEETIITSLTFGTKTTVVERVCKTKWAQACYHYSSAIAQNPQWETLKCVHANHLNKETKRPGPKQWYAQHDESWLDKDNCDADEYPPRYLLSDNDPEIINAGQPGGQLIRYLDRNQNRGAAHLWNNVCFAAPFENLSVKEFRALWNAAKNKKTEKRSDKLTQHKGEAAVDLLPFFKLKFEHASNPPANDGMFDNPCWPSDRAAGDPGMVLFSWDPWYNNHAHLYDFGRPYVNGTNGS